MRARILYAISLVALVLYSFVLIDPNITFFNNSIWASYREIMVQIGYYNRPLSWYLYCGFIAILFGFHWYFLKKSESVDPFKVALLVGGILLFSYPLISHDFFNYMFDAKILTYYHQNPYAHAALDYPADTWLRFMHWVHRPYPYGPVFLAISLVPSFLGLGKFIIHFYLLKATMVSMYLLAVYFLAKINKRHAVFLATQPLVLIEGLLAGHNDLLALSLGIVGLYYMFEDKTWKGKIMFVLSAGIKFTSAPYLLLMKNDKYKLNMLSFLGIVAMLCYFTFVMEIQPWYFLNLLVFLPLYPRLMGRLQILFAGLLLSYYPYIRLGGWDSDEKVAWKHWIILAAFIANAGYLAVTYGKEYLRKQKNKETVSELKEPVSHSSKHAASPAKAHKKART